MKIRTFFTALACLCFSINLQAVEPKNLDLLKEKLMQYYNSGEYARDQTRVGHQALKYLKARVKQPRDKPLAIVLDIDETSLSNYPDMVKMGFGGTVEAIDEAEGRGTDPAIEPILKLYNFAKKHEVAVFFITGRREKYRTGTVKNLKNVGFENWDGLIMKPQAYNEKSAVPFKVNARKQIEAAGYTIVLNVGDQASDLAGKHAEKVFKMPNPFYSIG